MGLYIFFLPPYCSEMNPIELEWQHLKKDELCGQIFNGGGASEGRLLAWRLVTSQGKGCVLT
ncbi:MAG: transposase [Nostoc sp.]